MDKGVYSLIFRNRACLVRVGALGEVTFRPGWHVYCGSALGSGGLSRVTRHIGVANGRVIRPHWHVDYLLAHPSFVLTSVACSVTTRSLECAISLEIATSGTPVPGFGCSDCHCTSHLTFFWEDPTEVVKRVFDSYSLPVRIIHKTQTIGRGYDSV